MPSKPRLQSGVLSKTLVRLINSLLATKNVSRRELADRLGTSHTYLNNRLNGSVDFTVTDIESVTNALDIDLVLLMTAAEWMINGAPTESLAPNEMNEIASWFAAAAMYYPEAEAEAEGMMELP